jgi:hypothetical protein
VSPGPEVLCYDINTTTHNFFAGDVLVHNCLDEIDEMEKDIYDAAQGQAMAQPNAKGYQVNEMTVASSTWQNPIGTFQEVRDGALLEGLPVRTWCWREILKNDANPYGWMDPDFIARKKRSVGKEMFRIEYDLGEPKGGNRAFDVEKVKEYFVDVQPVREHHRANDDMWVFEEPQPTGTYAAAADWAKETDKTSISVFRIDLDPAPMVYQRTFNRQAWPVMVDIFNSVINDYHAMAGHDATGVGNVVNDLVDERVLKVILMDQKRKDLLNEYVADFEIGRYRFPKCTSSYNAHRATTMAMIWAGAATAAHIPDEIISAAIANRVRRVMPPPVGGALVTKSDPVEPARIFKDLDTPPPLMATGDVVMFDDDADGEDIAIFSLPQSP